MRRHRLPVLVALSAVLAATVLTAAPAAAGGGCHRPATEGRGTTMALSELCFRPTVLRVAPGSEVTIVNRDTLEHPLARPGGQWGWGGAAGDRTTVRLERSGVYPFFCYAHPGMVGVVVVGDGSGSGDAAAGDLVATAAEAAPAAPAAAVAPSDPARPAPGSFPTAWMVLVALAALVGAAAGTRLAARSRAS
jgi:plastocyanin